MWRHVVPYGWRGALWSSLVNELIPANKESELDEVTSAHHIITRECEDLDVEIELRDTPEILEDWGQAIIDDLKELNLGTAKEPHLIYVSSLLMLDKETEYFNLLLK